MKKVILISVLITFQLQAKFTVSPLFTNDMILQCDKPAKIWGKALPNEEISIILKTKKYTTKTLADSTWKIDLGIHEAGGPFDMFIQSAENQEYFDSFSFGDVWLCGGQSNMEFTLNAISTPDSVIKMIKNDNLRFLKIRNISSTIIQKDIQVSDNWMETNAINAGKFSAVAYYFGDYLTKTLNKPIGLISNNWGGSPAEVWMSKSELKKFPEIANAYNFMSKNDSLIINSMKLRTVMLPKWIEEGIKKDSVSMLFESNKTQIEFKNWQKAILPFNFKDINLDEYNGIVWVVMEFDVPENMMNKIVNLNLGLIDDADHTFINGVKIGGKFLYNEERNYKIDPSILKKEKNLLAIRIVNYGGEGNIIPSKKTFFLYDDAQNKYFLNNEIYAKKGFDLTTNKEYVKPVWRYMAGWQPSSLYNSMIAPMLELPIKGVIWYQGESNAERAYQYRTLFPALISNWRADFKQPNLPFLFVQLANFKNPSTQPTNDSWAELREAQAYALKLPYTAMSTAIDVGDANDIHPKDKKTVGNRLAAQALKMVYGKKIVADGPTFTTMKIEGKKIRLSFKNLGSGLMTKSGTPEEFAIAGADKKFYWAKAKIENNTIVVSSDKVAKPVAVRYAWANNPSKVNTYNKDGFPMNPFRTDTWKGVTFGNWKIE